MNLHEQEFDVTILIADEFKHIRRSLARLFEALSEAKIVGEAENISEAIAFTAKLRPEVVIMDVKLPGGSGFEALRQIKAGDKAPVVIVLTNYAGEQFKQKSLDEGADYFFDKSTEFEQVVEVLKEIGRK